MGIPSITIEGADWPDSLKTALSLVGEEHSVCRITHGKTQVALVSGKWIPLLLRLHADKFTEGELDDLFDEMGEKNCSVRKWALGLSPLP